MRAARRGTAHSGTAHSDLRRAAQPAARRAEPDRTEPSLRQAPGRWDRGRLPAGCGRRVPDLGLLGPQMRCCVPQRRVRAPSAGCWLIPRQHSGCRVRALALLAASAGSGAARTGTGRCRVRCGSALGAGPGCGEAPRERSGRRWVNGGRVGAGSGVGGSGALGGMEAEDTWRGFLGDHGCGGGRDVQVWWRCSPSSCPVPLRVWGCAAGARGRPERGGLHRAEDCACAGPARCALLLGYGWGCARPARSAGGPAAPPSRSLRWGWGTREGSAGAGAPCAKTKRLPKMDEERGLPQRQGSVAVSDARCRPPPWLRPPPPPTAAVTLPPPPMGCARRVRGRAAPAVLRSLSALCFCVATGGERKTQNQCQPFQLPRARAVRLFLPPPPTSICWDLSLLSLSGMPAVNLG